MTLDKAIKSGKEKRKPYKGAKAGDPSCRNHKRCPYCRKNRAYRIAKRDQDTKMEMEDV